VRATINSDDPAYFPGYTNENFIAVETAAQLTQDEVVQLARNAFTVSWLPQEDKAGYLDALESYAAKAG
jgi:adenosine deaminase